MSDACCHLHLKTGFGEKLEAMHDGSGEHLFRQLYVAHLDGHGTQDGTRLATNSYLLLNKKPPPPHTAIGFDL